MAWSRAASRDEFPQRLKIESAMTEGTGELATLLAQLTGEPIPFPEKLAQAKPSLGTGSQALGYSQLNELLLLGGLDRVHSSFFAYLLDGSLEYKNGSGFDTIVQLEGGVERFRQLALLLFGNVKFAFKTLSTDPAELEAYLRLLDPIPESLFKSRHDPVLPVDAIDPRDAYLTGYLVGGALQERLAADPDDSEATELLERRAEIIAKSIRNQEAYYASDHMDVYVATSMRTQHDFIAIGNLTRRIFGHPTLAELKLRWFDPTQAFCEDRIDKGLAEALMLKRASCTIYLAQVTDTLGKDSELASTLAQGKAVIAFVPEVSEGFLKEHFETLTESEPDRGEIQVFLEQMELFDPSAAWHDEEVQQWLRPGTAGPTIDRVKARLSERIKSHYDKRAGTLKEAHPLGIQVNLETGVANGVLVARTPDECARLIHGILTRTLAFELEETEHHWVLREKISRSVFRVMTKDAMLTNTFWNFYLRGEE